MSIRPLPEQVAALNTICDSLDMLMNVDFHARGMVAPLYQAARARQGCPLTLAAARTIMSSCSQRRSKARPRCLIATGFIIRAAGAPETDGITGAALLARGISAATGALPVLMCEPAAVGPLAAACRGAGLSVLEASSAEAPSARAALAAAEVIGCGSGSAVVIPAPMGWDEASGVAAPFLDEVNPSLVLSIERPGRNSAGVHHNSWGKPMSDITAKVDVVYAEAARRGVTTIAIGDLGNELGMGALADVVEKCTPFGRRCACNCGAGVTAADEADVTVVGSVSDDAAYAVLGAMQAFVAFETATPCTQSLMVDPIIVEEVLRAAVEAGAVDGITGKQELSIDMLPLSVHKSLARLMQAAVEIGIEHTRVRPEYLEHLLVLRE